MDPYRIIKKPHVSEKGSEYVEKSNTYVFQVDQEATKVEIREAIESIWGVKVKDVRTMNVMGKRRRYGARKAGMTSSWKKAMVRLAEGEAIEALR